MQIFGSLKTGTYVVSRLLGFIMNIVLLAITGGYVHELVMDRIVQPVPIVMLVFFSAVAVYLFIGLCFYLGESHFGRRLKWMAIADGVLAIFYILLAVYVGLQVTAISCGKEQFTTTHLNRYGMGYFNYEHSFQGWAKSSYQHCQQSTALFALSLVVAISLISTGSVCAYNWKQEHSQSAKDYQSA